MIETSARLLQLLGLLQTGREWSAPALAEKITVDQRTVRRDVNRLRSLGYPVEARRGAAGGYRLGTRGQLPPLLLDSEEALAVALGLRSAAVLSVAGGQDAAERAMAKLEQVLPAELRGRLNSMDASLETVPSGTTVSAETVQDILDACDRLVRIRFGYSSVSPDGDLVRRDRSVEPCRLVQAGRRWYLLGWDLDRRDWRTFRLDRIADLHCTTFAFASRLLPEDAARMVSKSIAASPYRYQVRVLISAPAEVISEQVPGTVGVVVPHGDEKCLLVTGSNSLTSLAMHIGSLGFPFQVLDPPEFAEFVRDLGERLLAAGQ